MATHLPTETYETLARRIWASRSHKTATFAPNTTADMDDAGTIQVRLHGNLIARLYADGLMWLSDAGWPTQTTARRLRALVPAGHTVFTQGGHTYVKRAGRPDKSAIRMDDGAVLCPDD